MKRLLLMSAILPWVAMATSVQAQDAENFLRLGDLKSRGATQVSKAELDTLLPGARVKNLSPKGATRIWTNEASGKFVASTDLVGAGGGRNIAGGGRGGGTASKANGTWHIGEEGTYCVTLEWRGRTEQWCRYLFKLGDKYYGVRSLEDNAGEAYEFSFSR